MPRPPTIRTLANELHLSPTTVSDALRGHGRVEAATAKRVIEAAERAGYKLNPLTSVLMSGLRRSQGSTFRGTLAAIDISEPQKPHGPFPRQIMAGARRRGEELGFTIEEYLVGEGALSYHRLETILKSRGTRGVMILPAWDAPDLSTLDWPSFAGIYTDCVIEHPPLHAICPDHYRSMTDLLERLLERGYKRPGLFLEKGRDDRLKRRQSAAFRAFVQSHGLPDPVPVLFAEHYAKEDFCPWFKKHKPDVVLGHYDTAIEWMESCGAKLPQSNGYVCLNIINRTRPCAGIDLQPQVLGARAVELLIGQLQRNEYGCPDWPTTTTLHARWVEGPSVRLVPKPAAKAKRLR
jgi:LacI family transcriptional regulator